MPSRHRRVPFSRTGRVGPRPSTTACSKLTKCPKRRNVFFPFQYAFSNNRHKRNVKLFQLFHSSSYRQIIYLIFFGGVVWMSSFYYYYYNTLLLLGIIIIIIIITTTTLYAWRKYIISFNIIFCLT